MVKNLVFISDTHGGSRLALCPDEFTLDEGGIYKSSKLQRELMSKWDEFHTKWIPLVTKGEPYYLIHNGDAIEGNHHGDVTSITANLKDQRKIAYEVMKEAVAMPNCAKYYHVRGTEAHVGKSGSDEEELASQLGAIPDDNGNYARWELWLRFQGGLVHASHHVGTTGSAAYESTAVYKELVEAYNEAGRWGEEPPDVVVRSHRHRAFETKVPSKKGHAFAIVTPGWQLKTPFTHRIAIGRAGEPMIGGYLLRSGDEDSLYSRSKIWKMPRPRIEIAE
jgi:hypothetical protein